MKSMKATEFTKFNVLVCFIIPNAHKMYLAIAVHTHHAFDLILMNQTISKAITYLLLINSQEGVKAQTRKLLPQK